MRYNFTDKEWKAIENNITILVDTREQKNEHVLNFFESKKINYRIKKLDFGDYSCMLPAGSFEGQERDIYFDRDIVIERKNGIDELAGNFKDDGIRLKNELCHLNKYNILCFLFIEDENFDRNIRNGTYRSNYKPISLYNRIKKDIEIRYRTPLRPVSKDIIGSEIVNTLRSFVYEEFRRKGWIEENEQATEESEGQAEGKRHQ